MSSIIRFSSGPDEPAHQDVTSLTSQDVTSRRDGPDGEPGLTSRFSPVVVMSSVKTVAHKDVAMSFITRYTLMVSVMP